MTDSDWMHRALELAERGRGFVEPNPLVGAVVVRDGQCVGEGWHQRFGGPHAEVHALTQAGEAAYGATLYVTLEPCCHYGKTPPCTEAVLRAGIARVVAAMNDPFPQVAGRGTEQLRTAGVEVVLGVAESEARRLNEPYLRLHLEGRPQIHAKWAMSLDGKIATRTGHSQWISNELSRQRVHDLRGRMDAILVGRGTVEADDPLLTARPPGPRRATRIVLSRQGRLPLTSQLARTAMEVPLLVVTAADAEPSMVSSLRQIGADVLAVADLPQLLQELGRRRFTNVLVEGGSAVLGAFLDAGLIDEVHAFLAPMLLGGETALSPFGGDGVSLVEHGLRCSDVTMEQLGEDLYVHGRLRSVIAM